MVITIRHPEAMVKEDPLRKLVLFLIVAAGLGVGTPYYLTGRFPWATPAPDEQEVETLQAEFGSLRQHWQQAGHMAAFGVDPNSTVDPAIAELNRIEATLTEITPRLQSHLAQIKAERLRQDLAAFKAGMH